MSGKAKSKAIRVRKNAAKKECVLRKSGRSVRRRTSAIQSIQKSKKKYPSLLGKMKDTILYENDLISPINETWDAEKESE
jgi:hypothetical protein